jgi:hypothetical protein
MVEPFVEGDELVIRHLQMIGLMLLIALPVFAQDAVTLSAPSLKPSWDVPPGAPTPVDENGNPIPPKEPTAEEKAAQEAARSAEILRQQRAQFEEIQRQAVEARQAADELVAAQKFAEEQSFHNRIMTAVYAGLAIVALLVGFRLFKKE